MSQAECLQSHKLNRQQLTWYSGDVEMGGNGPGPSPQPLNTRQAITENIVWNTELRAMKTAVAGAVGANCGEANLTYCGPMHTQQSAKHVHKEGKEHWDSRLAKTQTQN